MPWRISYQHPLRPDDGGIRFVPDQSEAAAEKLRLELRGYAVSTPTQAAAPRLMLWEVAYSDGVLTGDEDTLIRRVAGLIYVPDRERGEAKLRVRERLERRGNPPGKKLAGVPN
jgi:Tellurite resistance protein TerB